TIPDYATDVEGVKFSGVRADSPAANAGLQGGDILVEFAGRKIANIYDYTYALDAAKIGEPVEIVVLREGRRVRLSVTAEVRRSYPRRGESMAFGHFRWGRATRQGMGCSGWAGRWWRDAGRGLGLWRKSARARLRADAPGREGRWCRFRWWFRGWRDRNRRGG